MSNVRLRLPLRLIEAGRAAQYANRERQGARETDVKLKRRAKKNAEDERKKEKKDKEKLTDSASGRRVGGQLEHDKREQHKIWTRRRRRGGLGFLLGPEQKYTENKISLTSELDQDSLAFTDPELTIPLTSDTTFMKTANFDVAETSAGLVLQPGVTSGSNTYSGTIPNEAMESFGKPHHQVGSVYKSALSLWSLTEGPVTGFDYENFSYVTASKKIPYSDAKLNWTADKTTQSTFEFFVILDANPAREFEARYDTSLDYIEGDGVQGELNPMIYRRSYINELIVTIHQGLTGSGAYERLEFYITNWDYLTGDLKADYSISNIPGRVSPGKHHVAAVYDLPNTLSIYLDGKRKFQNSSTFNTGKVLQGLTMTYAGREQVLERDGSWVTRYNLLNEPYFVWIMNSQTQTYSTNVPKMSLQSFRFTPSALYSGESFTPPTTITDLED